MLQQALHVHLKHDIQRVLPLCHMEDWLRHELVKLRNMLLSEKIALERLLEVGVQ